MEQTNLFKKIEQNKKARLFLRLGFILLWIIIWQVAASIVNLPLFFPTPIVVVKKFFELIPTTDFWLSIGNSMWRIMLGYTIGLFAGLILAIICSKNKIATAFFSPVMHFFKTVPVACFVILALIWFTSKKLSIIIGIIMVTPVIFENMLTAILGVDNRLLNMARVHRVSHISTLRYVYFSEIYSELKNSVKLSLSLCFKAAIAAELIGIPELSIGEMLHDAKIYIEADVLFAWTLTIILLSFASGKIMELVVYLVKLGVTRTPINTVKHNHSTYSSQSSTTHNSNYSPSPCEVSIKNLCKSYEGKLVLADYSLDMVSSSTTTLSYASGWGKTTITNIILGITPPDSGEVIFNPNPIYSCVFQEDRLVEALSGLCNIAFVSGSDNASIISTASLLGLSDADLSKPVSQLSGGQKRRVSILRALLTKHNLLILDEPYTGLDEGTIKLVNNLLEKDCSTKLIISHIE